MSIKDAINAPDVNDAELEELSLEELRKLADGEQPVRKEEKPKVEPKDEETDEIDDDEEDDDEDEEKFTRTIDLGDGSGIQVFKAATLEKLLDKLSDAQVNATKK